MSDERKKATNRQVESRDKSVSGFSKSLKLFLKRELDRLTREVQSRDITAIDAARLLGSLRSNLAGAGLGDVLAEIDGLYAGEFERLDDSLRRYGKGIAIFTGADVELVQALSQFDAEQLADQIDISVDELRSVAMRQVIGGQKVDLADVIDTVTERAARYGETVVGTALAGLNRGMILSKSDELELDLFVYLGPDDEVTRPFCEARVNKVWTRQEIDGWDNEQGLDAAIYLGGYNCRHQLSPISEEDAKREYGYSRR